MKILANRKLLLDAYNSIAGVIPSRSPKPILQSAKLSITTDRPSILATDLEVGVRRSIGGIKIDRPGEAILPARFHEILRLSTDEEISIESEGPDIRVRGLSGKWRLPAEDPDLFPTILDFTATSYHTVSSSNLQRAIRLTAFATDPECTRYALGGTLWEFAGETFRAVGTDGRRLAEFVAAATTEGAPDGYINGGKGDIMKQAPVLPMKALKTIQRVVPDDESSVDIQVDCRNGVMLWADGATIYTRLVEGRFPRYQDVFPSNNATRVTMDAAALLGGIRQAAISTNEESRGVDFCFGWGFLRLTGIAADAGESDIEIPVDYGGPQILVTFDPRYITEMLSAVGPVSIDIDLIDGKNSVVFHVGEDYRFVGVPLTRDR